MAMSLTINTAATSVHVRAANYSASPARTPIASVRACPQLSARAVLSGAQRLVSLASVGYHEQEVHG